MELTSNQLQILIQARRAWMAIKLKKEQLDKEERARFEKLKEACQGAGSAEQILAKCDQILAQQYIHMIENGEDAPIGI